MEYSFIYFLIKTPKKLTKLDYKTMTSSLYNSPFFITVLNRSRWLQYTYSLKLFNLQIGWIRNYVSLRRVWKTFVIRIFNLAISCAFRNSSVIINSLSETFLSLFRLSILFKGILLLESSISKFVRFFVIFALTRGVPDFTGLKD